MTAPRLTIGEVLRRLTPDFPDVTVSKIRFLEAEGLVTPDRTASGYRSFSSGDVDRLRYILNAQRDRFWPLRVIREALDAIDRGLEPGPDGATAPPRQEPTAPAPQPRPARHVRLTAVELGKAADVAATDVQALVTFGLVRPDGNGHFDGHDLAVARAAADLIGHGIEVRHLRAFRAAADRELDLVENVVAPLRRTGSGRDEVVQTTEDLVARCHDLHTALVRRGLVRP